MAPLFLSGHLAQEALLTALRVRREAVGTRGARGRVVARGQVEVAVVVEVDVTGDVAALAALLLAADIAVRLIPATSDIKVGVLTSIIGVPFFLYLLLQYRRGARHV